MDYYGNSCCGAGFDIARPKANPIVAFWFNIFIKQMKQKSKHNFNKNIKRNFLLISLALFPVL